MNIKTGDLVFDVGALDGKYTDLFLSLGARVVALEPQAGRAGNLRAKYESEPRVTVVEAAVSNQVGEVKLYPANVPWLATMNPEKWSRGRFQRHIWGAPLAVRATTLDALIEEYGLPAFIKIDVEGCELQVLGGLNQAVPELCFEFVVEYLPDVQICCAALSTIGDYEFAPSWYENNRPEAYGDVETLLQAITQCPLPLLWGDIYARLKHG